MTNKIQLTIELEVNQLSDLDIRPGTDFIHGGVLTVTSRGAKDCGITSAKVVAVKRLIDYDRELKKLKDDLVFILKDLSSPMKDLREQGDINLSGLIDKISVLAQLKRGENPICNTPHAEAMLEDLGL